MARGIHRFVVRIRQDIISVRAQSASRSGQAYTVGSHKVAPARAGKAAQKSAIAEAISHFYPTVP